MFKAVNNELLYIYADLQFQLVFSKGSGVSSPASSPEDSGNGFAKLKVNIDLSRPETEIASKWRPLITILLFVYVHREAQRVLTSLPSRLNFWKKIFRTLRLL